MNTSIRLEDIQAASERIAPYIVPLRITESPSLSKQFSNDILLAHEYLQTTGAFKLRGAMNSVLQLEQGTTGVTAVSTGNHGRALAYSARQAGVPCIICMSELVPQNKLEAIRARAAWMSSSRMLVFMKLDYSGAGCGHTSGQGDHHRHF